MFSEGQGEPRDPGRADHGPRLYGRRIECHRAADGRPISHRAPDSRQSPLLRRAASQWIEKPSPSRSAQPRPRATAKDRFKVRASVGATRYYRYTPATAPFPRSCSCGSRRECKLLRYPEHDAEPRHVIHRTYVIEPINVQRPPGPWFTFTQRVCRDEVPVSGNAFLLPPSQR